jgi:hypothetical protein
MSTGDARHLAALTTTMSRVMVDSGEVFYLTAQYPVDDAGEIDPIVEAMANSYTLPTWQTDWSLNTTHI